MPRIDQNQMDNLRELMETILSLRDMEECKAFFSDLCTVQELISFSQRLQVAKRLLKNETYETIRSQIPVSSTTITRINTALQYGAGGYRLVLCRKEPPTAEDTPEQ